MVISAKLGHVGRQLVSVRRLAQCWDCDRSTVTRILAKAGIFPYALGEGKNGTIRYDKQVVDEFMAACHNATRNHNQS